MESDQFVTHPDTQVEIGSLLCVPLLIKDQRFGVINLSHSKNHTFQSHDLYLFNVVANFVALAVHNALGYERVARRTGKPMQPVPANSEFNPVTLLAGGVSHDLNNVLAGLMGYTELLELQLGEDDSFISSFDAIQEAGQNATEIVGDLAALGALKLEDEDPFDLNLVINQFLFDQDFRQLVDDHPDIRFDHNLESKLPEIQGRMDSLLKVLQKLFAFAYEATGSSGKIIFETRTIEVDADQYGPALYSGPHVLIRLAFGGPSLGNQDVRDLFLPYYGKTQLGLRSGGLGLAAAARIIYSHHGWIEVEPLSESGNWFSAFLPAYELTSGQ